MQYSVGKVKDFDGVKGMIVTPDANYLFVDNDSSDKINNGDLVKFRGEMVAGVPRAYFVKPYDKNDNKVYIKVNHEKD